MRGNLRRQVLIEQPQSSPGFVASVAPAGFERYRGEGWACSKRDLVVERRRLGPTRRGLERVQLARVRAAAAVGSSGRRPPAANTATLRRSNFQSTGIVQAQGELHPLEAALPRAEPPPFDDEIPF